MTDAGRYRLADSTAVEPLINSWAAWADLLSPAPYSLHLLHYQCKLLASFLADPEVHARACRNPKLLGGRFVDLAPGRAPEVARLLAETERGQADNLELARAITAAFELVTREATGHSLEPLYGRLPGPVRGYAELLYDYYNHPTVRLIEGLLYESPYYKEHLQSLRLLHVETDDSRRFFLNTPRLPEPEQVEWAVPFASAEIDDLFRLDSRPQPLGHVRELLGLGAADEPRLRGLLTSEPAPPAPPWEGPGVRVRYFGHACVLVECGGVSVLTDPFVGVRPARGGVERFGYADLPERIDFAVVTHGHHDHFVAEALLRLRHRVGCLVVPRTFGLYHTDPSLKLMARRLGFRRVVELDALESVGEGGVEVVAVPFLGEHADLAHGKSGYVVRAGGEAVLFGADSDCLERRVYERVREAVGRVGTVFIGMECVGAPLSWMYGAMLPSKPQHGHDQSRRTKGCDAGRALELCEAVGAERCYIYAMGSEPWLRYSLGLALTEESAQMRESGRAVERARERGFTDARRLFGKFETYLGSNSTAPRGDRAVVSVPSF